VSELFVKAYKAGKEVYITENSRFVLNSVFKDFELIQFFSLKMFNNAAIYSFLAQLSGNIITSMLALLCHVQFQQQKCNDVPQKLHTFF
jgi:hypothetical protein